MTVPTVRQQHEAPEPIRSLPAVADADYVDVFSISARETRHASAEEWALAGIDRAAGRGGQLVWRRILGLRLEGRPSPDHIAGWTIAERGDDRVRLEASSWCMTAHIVVHVGAEDVSIATCVHYDRALARAIWPQLAAFHRRAMPGLLRRAARVVGERSAV